MMLNENPVPPSDAVVAAITDMAKKGNRYPDRAYRLREKLGKLHGVAAENIALANGSSETIDAMMRIFLQPGDEFLCSNPTFEMFPSRAGLCNAKTVQIPLREEDLQYDVQGMLDAVNDKTKLILIINPNNPTGIFIDDADLIKFCELGIPLCIDEAYLDYHPQVEAKVDFVKKYPHVFLSHTFSKAFGLAGVRFGYVVGSPEVVEAFNLMYLPWNLSLMAMAAAEAILDTGEVKGKVEYNNEWMDTFVKELEAVGPQAVPAPRQLHARRRLGDRQDLRRDRAGGHGHAEALHQDHQADQRQGRLLPRHAGHARGVRALRDVRAGLLRRASKRPDAHPSPVCSLRPPVFIGGRRLTGFRRPNERTHVSPEASAPTLEERCIDTIRFLAVDGVQKAKSGHPGMPMGAAAVAHTLFTRHLRFDPADPGLARSRPLRALRRPRPACCSTPCCT